MSNITLQLVQTITVGAGGAASIEFTGIPQTGTDLLVVFSLRSSATLQRDAYVYINSLSSGYSDRWLYGDGTSASSSSNGAGGAFWFLSDVMPAAGVTASTFGNGSLYFPNYTSSTAKSASCDVVEENNATASGQLIWSGSNSTTSAITSVKLQASSGNLVQYSSASLYLVTKGSGGASVS